MFHTPKRLKEENQNNAFTETQCVIAKRGASIINSSAKCAAAVSSGCDDGNAMPGALRIPVE
jgi:hypothetical protein